MPSMNDRVVLLTGGATGIGRAIALDMAAAGAPVAIGDTNVEGGQQRRRYLRRVEPPP